MPIFNVDVTITDKISGVKKYDTVRDVDAKTIYDAERKAIAIMQHAGVIVTADFVTEKPLSS